MNLALPLLLAIFLSLLAPSNADWNNWQYGGCGNFTQGNNDPNHTGDDDDRNGNTYHQWVPRGGRLPWCTTFDWRNKWPYNFSGDYQPMSSPWFGDKPINNALVWTVTGLPRTDMVGCQITLSLRGDDTLCNNDGIGFLWDDVPCQAQYFRTFTNLTGFGTWGLNQYKVYSFNITADMKLSNGQGILAKIASLGYFHFLVGDDTSVDYFKITYQTSTTVTPPSSIGTATHYSCNAIVTNRAFGRGANPYSDESTTVIVNYVDTPSIPFEGSTLISPHSAEKANSGSCFKHEITDATRYWAHVPSGVSLPWLTSGGWDLVPGASSTCNRGVGTPNVTFSVYTKRYEGNRKVVFGGGCGSSPSANMYFVTYAKSPTLIVAPSNPAASCKCSSTGDPHYSTFDGRKYDLYNPGVYHLMKSRDCTFDVQTYTFKYGTTVAVNGIVSIRHLSDIITLTRTPGASTGSAWTGSPIVRLNGVVITATTTTSAGMTATYISANAWNISIPSLGVKVDTVVSGNWFHVYPSISDIGYQRKVDGLCGNCDLNAANDFKFPNCSNAVKNTASKLACNDGELLPWATSWSVSNAQLVANTSVLTTSGLGASTYAACQAAAMLTQCPDLVPSEPPKYVGNSTITVVEPQEPSNWVRCNGSIPVRPIDNPIPPVPTPVAPIPLCTDRPEYPQIVSRCTECASTGIHPQDCVIDICHDLLAGKLVSDYQCPGGSGCKDAVINQTYTYGNYIYATLNNDSPDDAPDPTGTCQPTPIRIPPGWVIAEGDDDDKACIKSKGWGSLCLSTRTGCSHGTAAVNVGGFVGDCPTVNAHVTWDDGCYHPNHCGIKILIRKPVTPVCGNGILETGEDCDDNDDNDSNGCSNSCKFVNTPRWICNTKKNPTECANVMNDVGGQTLNCTIASPYCKGCAVTSANANWATCCECHYPCC